MTRAEIRAGALHAGWGAPRWTATEKVLDSYLTLGVDGPVVEQWAALAAHRRAKGWAANDNDLWIAATAQARQWPLVACDRDFRHASGLDFIYLPQTPESRECD